MKKLISISLILFLFVQSTILAQTKKLNIKEATIGLWRNYAIKDFSALKWRPQSNNFTYVEKYSTLIQKNALSSKIDTLLEVKKLNVRLENASIEQLNYFYEYHWLNNTTIGFQTKMHYVKYNPFTKKIIKAFLLDKKAANVHYNLKANAVAFTIANNLYITYGTKIEAITKDKNSGIVNGDAYVHRQEFGINNGIFWSPNGNYIAFYRKDETMVSDYPLLKIHTRPAHDSLIKYPMAGETSEQVTLGVYNLKQKNTIFLKTGTPKDHFLTAITWEPSENNIYIAILNRDQNHMWLNKYNRKTGNFVKTLFEEQNKRYVEPEHPLYFIPNKNQFLWNSRRSGFNHLYLYDTEGKLIAQETKGNWLVTDFMGFDTKGKNFLVQTTKGSPLDRTIYQVNLKTKKLKQITKAKAFHSGWYNSFSNLLIDKYSSTKIPRKIDIIQIKNLKVKNLLTATNTLSEFDMPKMTIGTIKAADGKTDLYYRLIKPTNFDPNKKYPAIIYVYGGPHAQLITDKWLGGARLWQYYMAQHGYVMLTVDNRGSANRGFAFESIIHRQLGQNEMADQMEGVKLLKSLKFVDMNKIGVHGWSFGGFMTTSLLLNHNDVFKVGVAGGPVMDWRYYEVMYGERYMDTPQENPEGYEKTSCLNKAANLKAKFLIIHGLIDPVVVPQNSLLFLNACVAGGTFPKFYFYGDHEHNVRGMDRIHLMKMISDFFFNNLK